MARAPRTPHERRRRVSADVEVSRVYSGEMYVRVNSIATGGSRPFVLVPGIGVSSTYFEKLAPHLNEFGPVHALDLPGFGGVPHPRSTLSIRQYADLVGLVIDEMGLDDPIIVGHSMGSQIVSDLVARRPHLSTLVLIGPIIQPSKRRIATQAVRFIRSSWHEPGTVKILAVSAYLFCGFRWFARVLPRMMTFPIEDRLPDIRAHTLVIRGEFDAVAPQEWVRRVGELLPSSRLWEISGAAHSVMYAHAEEVARLCVAHARRSARADGDDDTLRFVAENDSTPDAAGSSIAGIAEAIRGRLVETAGVLEGDDEKIAQGKSIAARAISDGPDADATRPS
jgi:pimeloyl-ACP methyl ester carboxylesterase